MWEITSFTCLDIQKYLLQLKISMEWEKCIVRPTSTAQNNLSEKNNNWGKSTISKVWLTRETAWNWTVTWEMGNFPSDNWELKIDCQLTNWICGLKIILEFLNFFFSNFQHYAIKSNKINWQTQILNWWRSWNVYSWQLGSPNQTLDNVYRQKELDSLQDYIQRNSITRESMPAIHPSSRG